MDQCEAASIARSERIDEEEGKLNQGVGGDVLGRKDGLGAAIGVGSDELERTPANAGDALASCPVSFPKTRPRERPRG